MSYTVRKSNSPVDLKAAWESSQWNAADELKIDYFFERPKSSDHHPDVRIKMLYDDRRICGLFRVDDRYIKAVATANQQPVCQDSCVEFFVKPAGAERYFNFEMNCGGTILLYHIINCRAKQFDLVPEEDLATIERFHTLPTLITDEIGEPMVWYLGFGIPIEFFRKYSGINPELSGQRWTANFTKCADLTSHPHWCSWMKLSRCDFHLPDEFDELIFE